MNTGYAIEREDRRRLRGMSQRLRFTARDFTPPPAVDPRDWLRVENQGPVGSCRGFCRSTGAELAYYFETGRVIQYSPMWCYLRTQARDGLLGRDAGSTIEGGVKVALEEGHCTEQVFPYPGRYTTRIPEGAAADAAHHKCQSSTWIDSADAAYAFLAGRCGAIDVGAGWPLPFDRSGVLRNLTSVGTQGGHAWSLVGYLAEQCPQGKPIFLMVNSHSSGWGKAGFGLIHWAALESLLRHRQTSAVGLSHMSVPEPQPYDFAREGLI